LGAYVIHLLTLSNAWRLRYPPPNAPPGGRHGAGDLELFPGSEGGTGPGCGGGPGARPWTFCKAAGGGGGTSGARGGTRGRHLGGEGGEGGGTRGRGLRTFPGELGGDRPGEGPAPGRAPKKQGGAATASWREGGPGGGDGRPRVG
jgi:hypothetical protein